MSLIARQSPLLSLCARLLCSQRSKSDVGVMRTPITDNPTANRRVATSEMESGCCIPMKIRRSHSSADSAVDMPGGYAGRLAVPHWQWRKEVREERVPSCEGAGTSIHAHHLPILTGSNHSMDECAPATGRPKAKTAMLNAARSAVKADACAEIFISRTLNFALGALTRCHILVQRAKHSVSWHS